MALETRCSTPGAVFSTHIDPDLIEVSVKLPHSINLTEAEAAHLERVLHNAMEMALTPLFVVMRQSTPETKLKFSKDMTHTKNHHSYGVWHYPEAGM